MVLSVLNNETDIRYEGAGGDGWMEEGGGAYHMSFPASFIECNLMLSMCSAMTKLIRPPFFRIYYLQFYSYQASMINQWLSS